MAKDNRTIMSAVRFGGTLYKPGMEDELEAVASTEQIARLTEKGAISGFDAKADKAKAAEEEAEEAKPKGKGK